MAEWQIFLSATKHPESGAGGYLDNCWDDATVDEADGILMWAGLNGTFYTRLPRTRSGGVKY